METVSITYSSTVSTTTAQTTVSSATSFETLNHLLVYGFSAQNVRLCLIAARPISVGMAYSKAYHFDIYSSKCAIP